LQGKLIFGRPFSWWNFPSWNGWLCLFGKKISMHVLLTNDDGPPSEAVSPYVHYLVQAIQNMTDWDLSIAVPNTQKSWIGKAHMIGHNVTASYIYSGDIGQPYDGPYDRPQPDKKNEWILLDGTPASCANIGIAHLNKEKGPVDLVISGPNYGRNSTALYIMSSGTVGASMEAALCGVKSISISYAFESRLHNPAHISQAAKSSVRLCQYLYDNWQEPVQVYSVNIPLCDELNDNTKVLYTHILENKWGAAFEAHDDSRESELVQFKWRPDFGGVDRTVRESEHVNPGNDGLVVSQGLIRYAKREETRLDIYIY
jgi:tubulin--tyrosine ligase